MRVTTIRNLSRENIIPIQAKHCTSFFCRLKGLTFRRHISYGEGLLLVQPRESRIDASIHMLGVFTDLVIVWINSNLIVVDTIMAKAWNLLYIPKEPARYVLEIAPARFSEFQPGDILTFD